MAKQLYDYWFVQFDFPDENGKPYKSSGGKMVWNEKLKREIPEGWHDVSLNELASPQRTIVKPQEEVLYQHFSIPSYDAGGSYELNYGHQIHSDKFLLREGQLLVSKLNPWFNRVLWVPEGKNMISSTEFVIMNPKQRSDSGYLYSIVKSKPFVDFCSQAATGTSHSQRRISPDVMLAFRFPYNPNVSERYGKTIEYIFSQQDCIKNLSRSLSKQRDEIIPLLLTGQVSVNYHLYAIEVAFCKFKVLIHRTMKEELIKTIIQKMGRSLDYHQQSLLRDTLHECLCEAQITFPEETNLSAEEDNNILVEAFISAKKIEGCSEKTLKYYQSSIHFLLESIRKPIFKVNTNDIRSFLASYQEGRQLSKVTIDNLRRIYSSFFSWLEDEDYITKSPVRRIHKVKTDSLIKETISDEALEMLRDSCTTLRDLAMVDLLASTGMRVGELVNLNIKDVNFQERQCLVFGKGNKEREVYFNARAKIHLQQYLDTRSDDNTALFVSLKSPYSRLSINGIEVRLRKLGTTCDIGRVHPHKFRRTLATMAIDKGMPIEQVQKLLGHVKIDTTLHYAMVNQTNVKMAHRKYIG